jgi:hypothetical protein
MPFIKTYWGYRYVGILLSAGNFEEVDPDDVNQPQRAASFVLKYIGVAFVVNTVTCSW